MAEQNSNSGAGAERPSGKRQARGVSAPASSVSTQAPARQREVKENSANGNPFTFLKQVIEEIRKVIWPTGRQMFTYTIVVMIFLVITLAIVWTVDFAAGEGVRALFEAG